MVWLLTEEVGTSSVSGTVSLLGQTDFSGVEVSAEPYGGTMTTAADGNFVLTGLYAGTYDITASKDGWSVGRIEVTLSSGQQLTGVDFALTPVFVHDVCNSPALSIPDNSPIGVSDVNGVASEGIVSEVKLFLDVSHTYIGDLIVTLTSPTGTMVTVHNRSGASADDIFGWYPDQLEPAGSLADFTGEEMLGDWTLTVSDHVSYDTGTLNEWCLRITYADPMSDTPEGGLPRVVALTGNYPNPFNPATTIAFELPRDLPVDLAVYDLSGRRVATLLAERLAAGTHRVVWDGKDGAGSRAASGLYFCRLVVAEQVLTRKMLLLK
ncbi:MAG: proprotein convertase P-domain-containing protein [bacterium]